MLEKLVPFIPAAIMVLFNTGLQVSGLQNVYVAIIIWVIAGLLCLIPLWCYRDECRRRIVSVMPDAYVIQIIGVAGVIVFASILGAGLILQRLQAASVPPPVAIETTPPVTTPSLPAVTYTSADVGRLLEVLYEANQFLIGEPAALEKKFNDYRTDWHRKVVDGGARQYADKGNVLIREFNSFYQNLNDFLYRKHPHYKEEIRVAMSMDTHPNEVVPLINRFVEGLNFLPDKNESNTVLLLRERQEPMEAQWLKFREWTGAAATRIEFMTTNLRKRGQTGYEKK